MSPLSYLGFILVTMLATLLPDYGRATDADSPQLSALLAELSRAHSGLTGVHVLDKGEESLLARAWLADHAERAIDVQYFIWSSDNIGILAAEGLLRAADRGVRVRVLVDDLLIDAPDQTMLALDAHPNAEIRIYNPQHAVGVSRLGRLKNMFRDFRKFNQRMHDKALIIDGAAAIIGGRNMADEYYDYDQLYNFRDRDVLLLGPAVDEAAASFSTFWNSTLAVPVAEQLADSTPLPTAKEIGEIQAGLHAYAADPANFAPNVREALDHLSDRFPELLASLTWTRPEFIHDLPGKNNAPGLAGGGASSSRLIELLAQARSTVVIQSPYLVMPEGGFPLFRGLSDRGVTIIVSTNSLPSTDNIMAFSGYHRQRDALLAAGIRVYEFKPQPEIRRQLIDRLEALEKKIPTFAIHAKTMVIDSDTLFIGTFNLDPRSLNLNTEIGVIIEDKDLAASVEQAILTDTLPENSWQAGDREADRQAGFRKRIRLWLWKLLPLTPLL